MDIELNQYGNDTRFPILYARAKTGKTKWWQITVTAARDHALLTITHASGINAKAVVSTERIDQGKNLGRANATDCLRQALNEAESRWRNKCDNGYTPAEVQEVNTNTLGLPMPMLAHPIQKLSAALPQRCYVQPKLDGYRAMVGWQKGELVMWSRRGKRIETMAPILERLLDLPKDFILDGELYIHRCPLQELGSFVKKAQVGTALVEYHIYDCYAPGKPELTFQQRIDFLNCFDVILEVLERVQRVPTYLVSPSQIGQYFAHFRQNDYEGAMVRLPESPYEAGYRSSGLLKVKAFHDGEFEVIDVTKGTPRVVKGEQLDVGVLTCRGLNGHTFKVLAPGAALDKHTVAVKPEQYIGRKVTVQYAHLTRDAVPFHPVALRWREDL